MFAVIGYCGDCILLWLMLNCRQKYYLILMCACVCAYVCADVCVIMCVYVCVKIKT